jgi:predicted alpha/beta superfamily hydrolase
MKILAEINGHFQSGEKTIHTVRGRHITSFDKLQIVCFDGSAYNMLYFRDGEEVTDAGHDSVEELMSQAQFEFGIPPDDWRTISGDETGPTLAD